MKNVARQDINVTYEFLPRYIFPYRSVGFLGLGYNTQAAILRFSHGLSLSRERNGKDAKMEVTAIYTKIDKTIQVNSGVIVLESTGGFPRSESNLYLVGLMGEIIWKAERPDANTLYSKVKLNEDGETFSAYTLNGHACDLELKTGKLITFTRIQ